MGSVLSVDTYVHGVLECCGIAARDVESLMREECASDDVSTELTMTRQLAARIDLCVGDALGCGVSRRDSDPQEVLAKLIAFLSSATGADLSACEPLEGEARRNEARCRAMRFRLRGISKRLIGRSSVGNRDLAEWLTP